MHQYDIIGDIHGHADALTRLLDQLDYRQRNGCYQHPRRKVVFLGDFIDSGQQNRPVINLVKPMVECGVAYAVMGNHEYNAICYHTKGADGQYLRQHSQKNKEQHQDFLVEYFPYPEEQKAVIDWFKTLPLFLEMAGLRLIHACWHQPTVDQFRSHLDDNNCLTPETLVASADKQANTFAYQAIETLLKGPEIDLPEGHGFVDQHDHKRDQIRISWWNPSGQTYRDLAIVTEDIKPQIPDKLVPMAQNQSYGYSADQPPVFFGHYWQTTETAVVGTNVACLDWSVAKGGRLAAYRWEGDSPLSRDQIISVKA